MRYGAEHKQQTRERVLKEAARAIREEGVQKVGVAAVMSKAGLTHGGFYAHFPSRDDFIAAGIDQMFLEGGSRLNSSIEGRSPAEGLAAYVDFYLSRRHCDARGEGCPLPFLSADAPRLAPALRERVAAGMRELTRRLGACLEAMDRPDPEGSAASLISEMVGAICLARIEPDPELSEAILARTRRALAERFDLRLTL